MEASSEFASFLVLEEIGARIQNMLDSVVTASRLIGKEPLSHSGQPWGISAASRFGAVGGIGGVIVGLVWAVV